MLRGSPEVPGQNLGSQELREDYSGSSTPPELASEAVDHSEGQALRSHLPLLAIVYFFFTSLSFPVSLVLLSGWVS